MLRPHAATLATALLLVGGCANDPSGVNSDTTDPENRAGDLGQALGVDTSPIKGTLYVDDLSSVIQARSRSGVVQCTAPDLAGGLGQAAKVILITDPDGTAVDLGRLGVGRPDTARDRGREIAIPGTCTFNWTAQVEDDLADGVYTAAVPELDVEARFTADDATQVALRYDP